MIKHDISPSHAVWELVEEEHFDPGLQPAYAPLYRYIVYSDVAPGEAVCGVFGEKLVAPAEPGTYSLYAFVHDGTNEGHAWYNEKGEKVPRRREVRRDEISLEDLFDPDVRIVE